jgi:REP element-mobilizing transposase RayT
MIMGMPDPMVIGYHLVWTLYGWWLPNDPRGSTSRFIRSEVIFDLGNLHYGRKRIQPASSDLRAFYEHARAQLKCELLELTPQDVLVVAESFAATIAENRYTCYACAIMPDHIHLLIRKHKHDAETMIANFQSSSRLRLRASGLRSGEHPVWGGPGWKVFLDHPEEIRRTIKYIEDNPIKMRQPYQKHPFVIPYNGWPLHPGHSPHSPYAKRLRDARRY